ncbi:MAG: DnaJ domain-containing protein [Rhodospirillales bacterium]|nr:DnaJ domain-containing protein [Rhodospirillales bacterium]
MKDPYTVLGVARGASQDQIKKAFRKLARERHPDSNQDDPWAEDGFKELTAAYDLLSDADQRGRYDRGEIDAAGNQRRPGGWNGPGGQKRRGNPFENIFRQRKARGGDSVRVKGANVSYSLKVSFDDAMAGARKRVSMTNGKRLDVAIPPGTESGQILRLKGQGMPGIGGGADGDAHVEILIEDHALFTRRGNDIHIEMPVTLPEAVLGGKIEAPTIDGMVSVTVPKGSNTGTVLRLKEKGVKGPGASRGDQYVELKVVLPETPDKELADFLKRWEKRNPYEVRPKKAPTD